MSKTRFTTLRKCIPLSVQFRIGDAYSRTNLSRSWSGRKEFRELWASWEKSEWHDRETLEKTQWEKFKKLLTFAYDRVPYYWEKCQAVSVTPDDIQSYADLVKLPIIEKSDVKENPERFIPDNLEIPGCVWEQTSGSTGAPTRIYSAPAHLDMRQCIVMRYKRLAGGQQGDRWLFIQRAHFSSDREAEHYFGVFNPWTNAYILASTNMTPSVMEEYIRRGKMLKPCYLEGYSSAVYALATYVLEKKIDFHIPSIITRTDQLFPKYKKTIQEAFQTDRVHNFYGNVEGVASGCDCDLHQGKHTNMECQLIETLDEDGNQVFDQTGVVVGTNLENYAMPLIRYRVGDLATLSKKPCACGRQSYLLVSLEGRADDLLVLADGRKMSAGSLWLAGEDITGIKQYQIVQQEPGKVVLNISRMSGFKEADTEQLIHHLRNHLGQDVSFSVCYHDRIPLINGKFKFIVSNVKEGA